MMSDSRTAGQLKPLTKKTQSEQVVDILKEYIASEELKVGDKLPPELTLAKMLNVSRSTIREAIRTLSVLGYIEIVNGKGSFLKQKEEDLRMNHIFSWFENHQIELEDFIEVRKLIEPYAVQRAISNGTEEELNRIDEIRREYEQEKEKGPGPKLGELDAEFHQAIVDATHNQVLCNIYKFVVDAFADYRKRSFSVQYHADNAIVPHRKIAEAIMKKDPIAAKKAMIDHLKKVYADMSFSRHSDDK